MENNFIEGLFVDNPREGAPAFIKGRMSINSAKLTEWLKSNTNEAGYVNIDLLESQQGKLYAKVNDFKPQAQQQVQTPPSIDVDDSDGSLPF